MQYFGTGSEKLEVFARENFINNITFSGGFDLKETPKIFKMKLIYLIICLVIKILL